MALTKKTATQIVGVVSKDVESFDRINTSNADALMTRIVPESWGISGDLRNWSLIVVGADPSDEAVARVVCVGIANATCSAINAALKASPGIPDVQAADTIDREKPASHTATLINMSDGSEYVFDWHKTLNVVNPFLYTKDAWKRNGSGVMFTKFSGW